MRITRSAAVAAALVAGLAVVGTDAVTYAATGDSLILGKLNKAGRTTHVTNTGNGPALSLHAKGKQPALAVDSATKIVRLNADRVDGRHAAALRNNVRIFTTGSGVANSNGAVTFRLPSFPAGRYLASYSVHMQFAGGSPANPTVGRCFFIKNGSSNFVGYATSTSPEAFYYLGVNGTDVINKGQAAWNLHCEAYQAGVGAKSWQVYSGIPVRVMLTRVDNTIGGNLHVTRSAS